MTTDAPEAGDTTGPADTTGFGDALTRWPTHSLVHPADPPSCEAAAMQLSRCANALSRAAGGLEGPGRPGVAQGAELAHVADALRELGAGLRDYGLEMARLAAAERALVEEVLDETAASRESDEPRDELQIRLHRLRSKAGRAAATMRHCADAVRARIDAAGAGAMPD